jgi:glycosyltransferase involved in cell wall biosynthesis
VPTIRSSSATPTILLPHFHIEDRYYHWNTYYQSMQMADTVVLAPKETCRLLEETLPINAQWLPGGGTDQTEFEDRAAAVAAFTAHRTSSLPFFLVLGRKSGNKRYQAAIAALKQLNRDGPRADLVLIGHDGDGIAISEPNVHYLGALPRQAVIGALYGCTALVSMSESESFGIVIAEAWMTERPVIVSSHSAAFRELVSDRVNGRLVSDVANLAEAMAEVLNEPVLAETWGRAGKVEAVAHYTWDALATDWSNLLDNITTAPAASSASEPSTKPITKTVGAMTAHV